MPMDLPAIEELRELLENGNVTDALEIAKKLELDAEDERTQILTDAGAEVTDALTKLYELTDGDEAQVGEMLYEINKAARRNARYGEDA